jgi:O-antigen ligase
VVLLLVALLYLAHLHDGGNTIIGGLALAATEAVILLLMLLAPWARKGLARGEDDLFQPALAFALTCLVAIWSLTPWVPGGPHPAWSYVGGLGAATLDRSNTEFEILKLGGLGCVFAVGYIFGRADDRARLAVHALVFAGALWAIWSLVLFGAGIGSLGGRLTATFQSANTAATLFAALLVIACGLAVTAQRRTTGRRSPSDMLAAVPYWAAAALFAACLFLTASRGGVVAAAAGLVLFLLFEALAGRVHLWPGIIGAATGAGLLVLQGPLLLSRLGQIGPGNDTRASIFGIYWRAFQESPLMGYGLGGFDNVNKLSLSASNFEAGWAARAAHNIYLQWLLEAGLIGALPMFACIGLVMFKTWRGMQRRRRATSLIRGLLAADAVFLVHGWTDFALQVPSMAALFAFILGLQLGLANSSSSAAAS